MSTQLPTELLRAVLTAARRRDVSLTLVVADLSAEWTFIDAAARADVKSGRVRLVSAAGGVPRELAADVDHLPMSLWDVDRLIAQGGLAVDIYLARVDGTADAGWASYGAMVGFGPSALAAAGRVGFELVPGGSPTSCLVDLRHADVVIDVEPGPVPGPARPPSASQQRVAGNVAPLLPDGATLQLGLGAIPTALVNELGGKHDLGLHSGVLPETLAQFVADGVVTGRCKSVDAGRHVATGVLGGRTAWGDSLALAPVSYTHDPCRLLAHDRFWAMNSAFEVDLAGQVNAEYSDGAKVASGAGQVDFMRAAHASRGGGSVIALAARTAGGRARIVPVLAHPVTTPGPDVDYVVTEHGVAALRGLTAGERRRALIGVAHPDDRADLTRSDTP